MEKKMLGDVVCNLVPVVMAAVAVIAVADRIRRRLVAKKRVLFVGNTEDEEDSEECGC